MRFDKLMELFAQVGSCQGRLLHHYVTGSSILLHKYDFWFKILVFEIYVL